MIAGSLNCCNKALERRWYPEPETVGNLYRQARAAGCAVFFKDSLKDAWFSRKARDDEEDDTFEWNFPKEFPPQILSWAEEVRTK